MKTGYLARGALLFLLCLVGLFVCVGRAEPEKGRLAGKKAEVKQEGQKEATTKEKSSIVRKGELLAEKAEIEQKRASLRRILDGKERERAIADSCFQSLAESTKMSKEIDETFAFTKLWFVPPLSTNKEDVRASLLASCALSFNVKAARYKKIEIRGGRPIFYSYDRELSNVIMSKAMARYKGENPKDYRKRYSAFSKRIDPCLGKGQRDCYDRVGMLKKGKHYETTGQKVAIVFRHYLRENGDDWRQAWQDFWKIRFFSSSIKVLSSQKKKIVAVVKDALQNNSIILLSLDKKLHLV